MPDFDLDSAFEETNLNEAAQNEAPRNADAQRQTHLSNLLGAIREKASSTLFSAGRGGDFVPLVWLSDTCDTFVYCDCMFPSADEMVGRLRDALERNPQLGERFRFDEVVSIDASEELSCWESRAGHLLSVLEPEHGSSYMLCFHKSDERCVIKITLRRTGDENGIVTLYFLKVEGIAAYLHLYTGNHIAPRAVLVRQTNAARFGNLLHWNGVFGMVLKRISPNPEIVVAPREFREVMGDTPWRHIWREFPEWHKVAFTANPVQR